MDIERQRSTHWENARGNLRFNPSILGHWIKFVEVLLSVPILVMGILLITKTRSNCYLINFLGAPMIGIGILLMIISLIGIVGAFFRIGWLLWTHLIAVGLLVILLFCFAMFTLDVTRGGSEHNFVAGKNYGEYVLGDYPGWMQHQVKNKHRWNKIVDCLKRSEICSSRLPYNGTDQSRYDQSHLSSIQSGCCKPPQVCNFTYVVATHWMLPTRLDANQDCGSWSNDPSVLCYNCCSCKAGVVQATRDIWIKPQTILLVVLFAILGLYALCGCGVFEPETMHEAY